MPPFCGRQDHLATLETLWQTVKQSSGPRVAVLLAESGLGKTRLAQEFYTRLVQTEQPEGTGYWPPELGADGNNLLVNPPPATWNAAADLTHLWWGIRLSDQIGRNQVATGALAAHVDSYLVPHLEPFHREQRRRQRLGQLAKVGGAVAVDAVLDLIPVLSLIKKAGEVGMELKGIHDTWRKDRQTLDAATMLGQRRDSLVDQLIDDLGKLFGGPRGRTVPAVILIDDAQFSGSDPGVTAFTKALLNAMTEGNWPLLLLVTHWEREFAEADQADATVAKVLTEHASQHPDQVEVLRLKPITGLEPLVTERLPGLPPHQVARLIERAGGNPQYLDEIVRLTMDPRSRLWFEGKSLDNPMTEAGLETLLSKSVKLQDVVAERFANSPEEVQKAVALAGVQGAEFLETLVQLTNQHLAADQPAETVTHALEDACNRHGYVAWLAQGQGAFSQRIYQEVAREFLPVFYDEVAAEDALRAVVQQVMLGEVEVDLSQAGYYTFMRLNVALFEQSDDEEQRRMAAQGLHVLAAHASATGELEVAYQLAARQAALLETITDARLDGDLNWLRGANDTLSSGTDRDARRSVLMRLVRLTGETYEDDINPWSASMYAKVLMDVAEFHEEIGNQELRSEAINGAVAVINSLEEFEPDVEVLQASLRLHRMYAAWFDEYGQLNDAAETYRYALGLAQQLAELDDHPMRQLDVATVRAELGSNAIIRGEFEAALPDLQEAVQVLRELAPAAGNMGIDIQLCSALDHLADAFSALSRHKEAEAILEEVLDVMRRHLGLAPGNPRSMSNVADSLERLAVLQRRVAIGNSGWQHVQEAVALRREVASRSGAVPDHALLGYSLTRAADIAGVVGLIDEGRELITEAVDLQRRVCNIDTSARSAWRLLFAVKIALDYALHFRDLSTGHSLLATVDETRARFADDADALKPIAGYLRDIEEQRARVLEESGDHVGAARVRAAGRMDENGPAN